jgi:hypothetical protein
MGRQSEFIILGKVKKLNSTTEPNLIATANTIILTIEEVFQAPNVLGDLTGKEITVKLQREDRVKVGQRLIFFANGWLYGKGIVVIETNRKALKDAAKLNKKISDAKHTIVDRDLQDRISRAKLVVVGKVSKIQPVAKVPYAVITLRDPIWWEATIAIESIEKGQADGDSNLIVLFPASTDEMWLESPKFRESQKGIWILQKDQQEKGWPALRIAGNTALDPLDFQSRDQLDRVKSLIKKMGEPKVW